MWSRRGGELYFTTAEEVFAVPVQASGALSVGQPRKLFENRYYQKGATHTSYDVARDGRFLMVQEDPGTAAGASLVNLQVVLHWFEELKAKLP